MKVAMSPIDDDKIYEVKNFTRNGPEGLQTIIAFTEYLVFPNGPGTDLAAVFQAPKMIFRGRAEVIAKIPAFNGQPARDMPQMVDFKIDAANLTEAFQGFAAGLAVAQKELQEDVEKQVEAMKTQAGMSGRGILRPG